MFLDENVGEEDRADMGTSEIFNKSWDARGWQGRRHPGNPRHIRQVKVWAYSNYFLSSWIKCFDFHKQVKEGLFNDDYSFFVKHDSWIFLNIINAIMHENHKSLSKSWKSPKNYPGARDLVGWMRFKKRKRNLERSNKLAYNYCRVFFSNSSFFQNVKCFLCIEFYEIGSVTVTKIGIGFCSAWHIFPHIGICHFK